MEDLKTLAKGAFGSSLLRNSKTIREERGLMILRNAERFYKRAVEDAQASLQDLEIERAAQLDMSPTNTTSLILATDFNPETFYQTDIKLTLKIREAKILLEEAQARYEFLFTDKPGAPEATA